MNESKKHFKELCKLYPLQKQLKQIMEDEMLHYKQIDEEEQNKYCYIAENVRRVDEMIRCMQMIHGDTATKMFFAYYIDGKKQKDIADCFHISLRTLQRRFQTYHLMIEEIISHQHIEY